MHEFSTIPTPTAQRKLYTLMLSCIILIITHSSTTALIPIWSQIDCSGGWQRRPTGSKQMVQHHLHHFLLIGDDALANYQVAFSLANTVNKRCTFPQHDIDITWHCIYNYGGRGLRQEGSQRALQRPRDHERTPPCTQAVVLVSAAPVHFQHSASS